MSKDESPVYHEGLLFKRQRGLHASNAKRLKFQERFCRLTLTSLDYYDPNYKKRGEGPKGQFDVKQLRIVEPMEINLFGREYTYPFQIGDQTEIMYFATKSKQDMVIWLDAFRRAAADAGNSMLTFHHHGVYGLTNRGRWSCCGNPRRACAGCSPVTTKITKIPALKEPLHVTGPSKEESADGGKSSSLPRATVPPDIKENEDNKVETRPPMIRSFTLADPLIKPDVGRIKERRKTLKEKEKDLEEGDAKTKKDALIANRHFSIDGDDIAEPNKILLNGDGRSDTNSPAPSDDSGRGTSNSSRPSSQVEVSENQRVSRNESGGKKTVQTVWSEQVNKKESKESLERQRAESDLTEEKYKDKGTHPVSEDRPPTRSKNSSSPSEVVLRRHPTDIKSNRLVSANLRASYSKRGSSGSDVSGTVSPSHRISKNVTGDSFTTERPLSIIFKGLPPTIISGQMQAPLSKLHQACKDGNIQSLEEEILTANLEETTIGAIPYTPLFLAYSNDHYQAMVSLLEHGANPNCVEPINKASVLHLASQKGSLDIVDLFIKYKADVNQQDNQGITPLMEACRNGHLQIVEFLLQNGANVSDEESNGRTPLHDSVDNGDFEMTELLLRSGDADPIAKDVNDLTPYDIAFTKQNQQMMSLLQQAIPKEVRPYALICSSCTSAARMITTLTFSGESLVSGSRDCHVCLWKTSDLSPESTIRVTDTVLAIDQWEDSHLVVGSTSVQVISIDNLEKRRTIADDSCEDESLENPPLHLVQYGPTGSLVTANVESNVVKVWPSVLQTAGVITVPEHRICVGKELDESGCVYSISVSPSANRPCLAVGLQPGKLFSPKGNTLVYCYSWDTFKLHQIFDAGDGGLGVGVHTVFSRDGRCLAIGCSENLCIWEVSSGVLLQKFTVVKGSTICSLCYSPDDTQLAAGLNSGEVQVFDIHSSNSLFLLPRPYSPSPATALAYSSNKELFAVGHQNGWVQLWEAYGVFPSNS